MDSRPKKKYSSLDIMMCSTTVKRIHRADVRDGKLTVKLNDGRDNQIGLKYLLNMDCIAMGIYVIPMWTFFT